MSTNKEQNIQRILLTSPSPFFPRWCVGNRHRGSLLFRPRRRQRKGFFSSRLFLICPWGNPPPLPGQNAVLSLLLLFLTNRHVTFPNVESYFFSRSPSWSSRTWSAPTSSPPATTSPSTAGRRTWSPPSGRTRWFRAKKNRLLAPKRSSKKSIFLFRGNRL